MQVLNVHHANDLREKTRKGAEQRDRESRIVFLEKKAQEAEEKLNEINSKWDCIAGFNDSVDIFSACESQKSNHSSEMFNLLSVVTMTLQLVRLYYVILCTMYMYTGRFSDVVNCKNNIIETLKNELAKADEKFVHDQQQHRNDVNVLANRIDEHIETMRNAYRRHLNLIEVLIMTPVIDCY